MRSSREIEKYSKGKKKMRRHASKHTDNNYNYVEIEHNYHMKLTFEQKHTKSPKNKKGKWKKAVDGMTEEVFKMSLPDYLLPNMDILFIGTNPSPAALYKGHHYAAPTNHFWRVMNMSGLTPEMMSADDDFKLLQYGIGFTNAVGRPTNLNLKLRKKELKAGCIRLVQKLKKYNPKIAVFDGKLIYEVFSGEKYFSFGIQPGLINNGKTFAWVMPSSSGRDTLFPSPMDKVPCYVALKKFRDFVTGHFSSLIDIKQLHFVPPKKNA